jgi:hypothetical protein
MIAEGLNTQKNDQGSRSPKKPACKLVGTDGNAFAIMGTVSRALERAGQPERAAEWQKQAMACKSYDDLLALCFEFVEVR